MQAKSYSPDFVQDELPAVARLKERGFERRLVAGLCDLACRPFYHVVRRRIVVDEDDASPRRYRDCRGLKLKVDDVDRDHVDGLLRRGLVHALSLGTGGRLAPCRKDGHEEEEQGCFKPVILYTLIGIASEALS